MRITHILSVCLVAGGTTFAAHSGAFAEAATDLDCSGCVNSGNIAKKAVTPSKLNKDAKPASTAAFEADFSGVLPNDGGVYILATQDIKALGNSAIVANFGVDFLFDADGAQVLCGVALLSDPAINSPCNAAGFDAITSCSKTRTFSVPKGTHTVAFACTQPSGAGPAIFINPVLNLISVPTLFQYEHSTTAPEFLFPPAASKKSLSIETKDTPVLPIK